MFEEFEHVRIKGTSITGDIVDITQYRSEKIYLVESDREGDEEDPEILKKYDVWNGRFPMYSCTAEQLEHV